MVMSIDQLLQQGAAAHPEAVALIDRERSLSYAGLEQGVQQFAAALVAAGLPRHARVAVLLDKQIECVQALLGSWRAGCIAVPVNPKLKPAQVLHVLHDSGAALLVTTAFRERELRREAGWPAALPVVRVDGPAPAWADWLQAGAAAPQALHRVIDGDPAALMYTSGSTGKPKGVVVTHRNLVAGCESVNGYLGTRRDEVILALLPLSFDAGLSQLTTALQAGATLVLHNHLRAQDVPPLCARHGVSSITAVPPLWMQLAAVPWDEPARAALRLFANTGGHMPLPLLQRLRALFPQARPFLMYGLTEAFRSTYLDPSEVDRRPDSIGKAIPNCEILVLRPDGSLCDDDEPGELVHRGAHVSQGYWGDPARTAERFRALPSPLADGLLPQPVVWSGDLVRRDAQGFLYFVGRRDEMIKVSGYRVSPTEIETVLLELAGVAEVAVFGVPDEALGQVPVAALVLAAGSTLTPAAITAHCTRQLPSYMAPRLWLQPALARSPNGKFDRPALRAAYLDAAARPAPQPAPADTALPA